MKYLVTGKDPSDPRRECSRTIDAGSPGRAIEQFEEKEGEFPEHRVKLIPNQVGDGPSPDELVAEAKRRYVYDAEFHAVVKAALDIYATHGVPGNRLGTVEGIGVALLIQEHHEATKPKQAGIPGKEWTGLKALDVISEFPAHPENTYAVRINEDSTFSIRKEQPGAQ